MSKRYRIRKLTPRECFILQGLTKEDCDKASAVGVSNSALYKAAGNGLTTNVIELIFEHLFKSQYDPNFETFDENFTQAVMA
jgi:DNA (cytosine-5)-methyltransferase 1